MNAVLVAYAAALATTTALSAALLAVIWRDQGLDAPAPRWIWLTVLAAGTWSLLGLAQVLAGALSAPRWLLVTLFELDSLGAYGVAPAFLLGALYATDNSRLVTWPVRLTLAGIFAVPTAVAVTNRWHWAMWSSYEVATAPFVYVRPTATWGYWAVVATSFLLTAVGVVLFGVYALRSRRVNRTQLTAALLVPIPAWGLHLAGRLTDVAPDLEFGVLGTALGMVVFVHALVSGNIFAVKPLARDTVVRQVSEGIVIVDDDDRVIDFNRAASELFPGLEDGAGEPLSTAAPDLLGDPAADGPDRFVDEVTRGSADGREIHTVGVSPVRVNGRLQGYTLTLRDVTTERERTEQLRQETEQLDQFVSTVSHDLRNPLTVAHGYVEAARAGEGGAPELAEAQDALDRMEDIIDDALTLARQGRAVTDRSFVPLAAVARDAWTTSDTAGADVDITVEDAALVYADEDRLRRLFENCYRNSAEHGRDEGTAADGGAPAVTVRVGRTDRGFYVDDDGPGIPEDRREEVLGRGYTTAADGTGLGLSIVDSIADAHGWRVRITESPSGGARVLVEGVEMTEEGTGHPDGSGDPGVDGEGSGAVADGG